MIIYANELSQCEFWSLRNIFTDLLRMLLKVKVTNRPTKAIKQEESQPSGQEQEETTIQSSIFLPALPTDLDHPPTEETNTADNTQTAIAIPLIHSMETQPEATVYHVDAMLENEHINGIAI